MSSEVLPTSFKTESGIEFHTNVITIGVVKKLKSEMNIDLFANDLEQMMTLRERDPEKWVNVLCVILEKQIEQHDLSAEAFAEELSGSAYFDSYQSVLGGLVDFFQSAGMTDKAIGIVKGYQTATQAMTVMMEKLNSLDVTGTITEQINGMDLQSEMEKGLKKNFQNLSGEISTVLSGGSGSPVGKT